MTPGIHRITMADYLADPCPVPSLSSGCAFRMVSESPLHAWWSHPKLGGHQRDGNNASDIGSVAHDLLLGGEGKICEIVADDWRTKAAKEQRDIARSNGLTPILAHQMIGARAMVKAAREFVASSEIAGVFDSGESELTVIAKEGETYLRTRPDWLSSDMRLSLSFKTTKAKVHPDAFGRLGESMGYFFSVAFYERCLRAVDPRPIRHLILAQEQLPPYSCALFELSNAKAAIERSQVERAIALWARCMQSGQWPGYGARVHVLEPKPWELAEEERHLAELEEAV